MTKTPAASSSPSATVTVDASDLHCPMPLLRAKQALRALDPGQTLALIATDAGSVRDMHAFVDWAGHQMLDFNEDSGRYYYLIGKGGPQTLSGDTP